MPSIDQVRYVLANAQFLSPAEQTAFERINAQCIGYSARKHYVFFRTLLANFPIRKVLVLGVYYGRDISYLCEIARQLNIPDFHVTGVDKFSDDFCADWPVEKKAMSWQQAGFGDAPDLARTQANLDAQGFHNVNLVKANDTDFMKTTSQRFDLVYIDTSHDETTVQRQISAAASLVTDTGLIGGDDYSDEAPASVADKFGNNETWGVIKAVKRTCIDHVVYYNWLWITTSSLVREIQSDRARVS